MFYSYKYGIVSILAELIKINIIYMKSRRIRKQKNTRRLRKDRQRLRGGAKIVYTCYFYEADETLEPGTHNPYDIELEQDSNQTLAGLGMNPGDYADTVDDNGRVIPLNLYIPILAQSHIIKNNRINIHK